MYNKTIDHLLFIYLSLICMVGNIVTDASEVREPGEGK